MWKPAQNPLVHMISQDTKISWPRMEEAPVIQSLLSQAVCLYRLGSYCAWCCKEPSMPAVSPWQCRPCAPWMPVMQPFGAGQEGISGQGRVGAAVTLTASSQHPSSQRSSNTVQPYLEALTSVLAKRPVQEQVDPLHAYHLPLPLGYHCVFHLHSSLEKPKHVSSLCQMLSNKVRVRSF